MWIPHEDTNRCTSVKFLFRVNIGCVTFTIKKPVNVQEKEDGYIRPQMEIY